MRKLLIDLNACDAAIKWAEGKSWQEIFDTCHRGDWLLWLHFRTNKDDLQIRTLAKGHCANTVRHLMKDKRSIAAVDMAISYGNGFATLAELKYAADAAYAAAAYAYAAAAYVVDATADAAYVAYVASVAYVADATAAKTQNQLQTADIVRQYIPIEKWNIDLNLKWE